MIGASHSKVKEEEEEGVPLCVRLALMAAVAAPILASIYICT
jgi:hypothetical protein